MSTASTRARSLAVALSIVLGACAGYQELGPKAERLLDERIHASGNVEDAVRELRRDILARSGGSSAARMRALAEGLWLVRDRRVPAPLRAATLRDLRVVLEGSTAERVAPFLHDRELAGSALHALADVPGPATSRILVRELVAAQHGGPASPALPAGALLASLAERDDEVARQALLDNARDPELGAVARRGLAATGARSAQGLLASYARRDAAGLADWSLWLQRQLDSSDLRELVLEEARAMQGDPSLELRRAAYPLLASQGGAAAQGVAMRALGDVDARLRARAVRDLADCEELAEPAKLRELARATSEDAAQQRARIAALRVLSARSDESAAGLLGAAIDEGGALGVQALELLAGRPSAAAVPRLRSALAADERERRDVGARGLMRFAAESAPAIKARGFAADVLAADVAVEHKRDALGVLAKFPHVESLALLAAQSGAPLRDDVARVKLAIVPVLEDNAAATDLLREVLSTSSRRETRRRAAAALRARGDDVVDWARANGVLTSWHVIGPFAKPEEASWKSAHFDVARVDVAQPVEAGGKKLDWQRKVIEDIDGVLDIDFLSRRNNATVYARTTIRCESAESLRLLLGSDDQVAVWVDGELVHAKYVSRACRPDQDSVALELGPGEHSILLKVGQGSGGWAFCARLVDSSGAPARR